MHSKFIVGQHVKDQAGDEFLVRSFQEKTKSASRSVLGIFNLKTKEVTDVLYTIQGKDDVGKAVIKHDVSQSELEGLNKFSSNQWAPPWPKKHR